MIRKSFEATESTAYAVADLMITAAMTAPKGCGENKIHAIAINNEEKDHLSEIMRNIGNKTNQDFFERDAKNIDSSLCVVIIGVEDIPLGLESCSNCGFKNCIECKKSGSHCAFNITDLGIAIGSAVSIAADHRIDNRVLYSAGKAAIQAGFLENKIKICYAIPLSTSSKSVFFDRESNNNTGV